MLITTLSGGTRPINGSSDLDLVVQEVTWIEPEDAFLYWADQPGLAFLDSGGPVHDRARYSYLAIEPFHTLSVAGNWVGELKNSLSRWQIPPQNAPLPFIGGAIGYFSYDLASARPSRHANLRGIPDIAIGFYDLVLGFDRHQRRAWITSSGFPENGRARTRRAHIRAEAMATFLQQDIPSHPLSAIALDWTAELSLAQYETSVRRIIEHIHAGDIYQANFTTQYTAPRPENLSSSTIYRYLRQASPAPFGAYFDCGPVTLTSASPERFLSLGLDRHIESRPIKGTRPRGQTPDEDARQKHLLLSSEKDRAENLMIVDLIRNDIGRVAEIGSVNVGGLYELESFAQVHHLVSSVNGTLRRDLSAVDLVAATLPGGSITGAPKIRAMEIIDQVESSRRGPYCGTLAWMGFDGAMDSSILIRTLILSDSMITANAGGGIVADSDPEAEYDEMLTKISPILLGRSL